MANDVDKKFQEMLQARLSGVQPKPEDSEAESEIAETWLELQRSIVELASAVGGLPDDPVSDEVHAALEACIDLVEAHELELEALGLVPPGDDLLEPSGGSAGGAGEGAPEPEA